MRINIAASHRFHLLDLAIQLEKQGHTVRFYSYVPPKRAIKFGLKKESCYSLYFLMMPFLAIVKLSKGADWSLKILFKSLDFCLSHFMKPCDVYIALGAVYKTSLIYAKKRFDSLTILEWGSKHNDEQQRILSQVKGIKLQSEYFKKRAIAGYELADYIAIPTDHVRQSFIERGISEQKLIQIPYGVDLSMFTPTELNKTEQYDMLMVGGWSYVKGCDLLSDFLMESKLTFLHVGPIVNLEFPKFKNMFHIDSVDQVKLSSYYSKAKIFVLPSRTEGLAMVQLQALACGLPIVCSQNTGGRDLRNGLTDGKWIVEMKDFTVDELSRCINIAMELAETQLGIRSYTSDNINNYSWKTYGELYNQRLKSLKKI